jgi:hypothetical protein
MNMSIKQRIARRFLDRQAASYHSQTSFTIQDFNQRGDYVFLRGMVSNVTDILGANGMWASDLAKSLELADKEVSRKVMDFAHLIAQATAKKPQAWGISPGVKAAGKVTLKPKPRVNLQGKVFYVVNTTYVEWHLDDPGFDFALFKEGVEEVSKMYGVKPNLGRF